MNSTEGNINRVDITEVSAKDRRGQRGPVGHEFSDAFRTGTYSTKQTVKIMSRGKLFLPAIARVLRLILFALRTGVAMITHEPAIRTLDFCMEEYLDPPHLQHRGFRRARMNVAGIRLIFSCLKCLAGTTRQGTTSP